MLGRDCAIRATRVGARGGRDNALTCSRSVARHRRLRRPCRSLSDGAARTESKFFQPRPVERWRALEYRGRSFPARTIEPTTRAEVGTGI